MLCNNKNERFGYDKTRFFVTVFHVSSRKKVSSTAYLNSWFKWLSFVLINFIEKYFKERSFCRCLSGSDSVRTACYFSQRIYRLPSTNRACCTSRPNLLHFCRQQTPAEITASHVRISLTVSCVTRKKERTFGYETK